MIDASPHRDLRVPNIPHSALPSLNFSQFDGSNPRLWVQRAETYFYVYGHMSAPPVEVAIGGEKAIRIDDVGGAR